MDLDVLSDKLLKDCLLDPTDAERAKWDQEYAALRGTESLLVISLCIVLLPGLACWRFAVTDY
jgi:hypothetical protein